jgi:hypothetical protein
MAKLHFRKARYVSDGLFALLFLKAVFRQLYLLLQTQFGKT